MGSTQDSPESPSPTPPQLQHTTTPQQPPPQQQALPQRPPPPQQQVVTPAALPGSATTTNSITLSQIISQAQRKQHQAARMESSGGMPQSTPTAKDNNEASGKHSIIYLHCSFIN